MTLYYYEEMTMREIGLALGVVESRVSQVHASAVVHLRAALKDLAARGAFDRSGKGQRPALASKTTPFAARQSRSHGNSGLSRRNVPVTRETAHWKKDLQTK